MRKDEFTSKMRAAAKREAIDILIACARKGDVISYSQLAASINSVRLEPKGWPLSNLLCDISIEEDASGRGMLSAIVVCKNRPKIPGAGFFRLAKRLGRNASDESELWRKERDRVFDCWSGLKAPDR